MTKGQDRLSRGHSQHARDVPQFPVYVTMTDRLVVDEKMKFKQLE